MGVRLQEKDERHCGSSFELLLNVTVPQMGRELVEAPMITFVEQFVGIPARGGPAPVVESISHALAVFSPVVEYISPASAVLQAPAPRARGDPFGNASRGVFLTRASCVTCVSACRGVFLTLASCVSCGEYGLLLWDRRVLRRNWTTDGNPEDQAPFSWCEPLRVPSAPSFGSTMELWAHDWIRGMVLRPVRGGRSWRWHDPVYCDGPGDCRHAVRFESPEQARRFHEEWMG